MSHSHFPKNIQGLLGLSDKPTLHEQIDTIMKGFPFSVFEEVQKEIDVPQSKLSSILGISARTLARRKEKNHFTSYESDRLSRFIRVFSVAVDVFGEKEKARSWLKKPNIILGGDIPIDLLNTDIGACQVVEIFHRIENGIYS